MSERWRVVTRVSCTKRSSDKNCAVFTVGIALCVIGNEEFSFMATLIFVISSDLLFSRNAS